MDAGWMNGWMDGWMDGWINHERSCSFPPYLKHNIPPHIFLGRYVRPSDTKSVQTLLPTRPPPNWDRFHQQRKNLFRKEIRDKIGVNLFSCDFDCSFSLQGSDGWNQPILSGVLPRRLKIAWSGLGKKGPRAEKCQTHFWMKRLEFH